MEGIIEALLDMEQKAESTLTAIQREKDKLPARIVAETEHVRQLIAQEMTVAIKKLHEASEKTTATRIQAIQEDSAKQLADVEASFVERREALRSQLFTRLTQCMT